MVVCVVASVLAAVAVPSFAKAKASAHKSELQAAVRAMQTAEELFLDTYGGFAEDWQDLELTLSPGVTVVDYLAVRGTYWSVLIRHSNSLVRCVGAYESTPLCWSPAEEWAG
jgi:type II secretory pathway pseudopilin PulG